MSRSSQAAPGPRVAAWYIRSPLARTTVSIIALTFTAWVVSFFLIVYTTESGAASLEARGFGPLLLSWLALSAVVSGGYGLGYLVLRNLADGQRMYRRQEVVKLALAESIASMCGGFAIGFLPMIMMADLFLMLAWTFAVGILFSFAVIMPRYAQGWQRALDEGYGHE
ncbi:hypothetical protein [Gulosibacter sp. 10]|uniref:hypothetical protein n=1 Tax=Gulosibacter sp. 10 TaxID=1255570 RepID=UPI00097F233C|nr:hypothetical protein [Gulosibacter sp. 10]SJM65707.1 hypothetical protein FM112_11205 [Gulosibacter sp. 10]